MYTQSLCGETIYKYKLLGLWPMDLVFMSTFDNQSMSIGCVGKLGHLSGFLRHYLPSSYLTHSPVTQNTSVNVQRIQFGF